MSIWKTTALLTIVIVLASASTGWAVGGRQYAEGCELTVNMPDDDPDYDPDIDYSTINDAIEVMAQKNLTSQRLGCIHVYPGTYREQLNSNQGGNDLPAHCDLVGEGTRDNVTIEHASDGLSYDHMYDAGVNCLGDNIVYNLSIENWTAGSFYVQNSVHFEGDGTLWNCYVFSHHGWAVWSKNGHLVVKGADTEIKTYFRACIRVDDTAEIYDCTLEPTSWLVSGQVPCGIYFDEGSSGIVDNVNIESICKGKEEHVTLGGIDIWMASGPFYITNTTIDLKLTTVSHTQSENFTLYGIKMRGQNYSNCPVLVDNCTISVEGDEDTEDGYPINVYGVYMGYFGVMEIVGNTSITTETKIGNYQGGGEYLLYDGGGTTTALGVAFRTVDFDPEYDEQENVYGTVSPIKDLLEFCVKDSSGDAVAGVEPYFGNLFLKGTLTAGPTPTATGSDEFIVQNSGGTAVAIINTSSGNMYIDGSLQNWQSPSSWTDEFIMENGNGPVAYIDSSGNLRIKGELFEESIP